jgi:hypothetical protein
MELTLYEIGTFWQVPTCAQWRVILYFVVGHPKLCSDTEEIARCGKDYTPLAVVSRARNTLRVSTTAGIEQIPALLFRRKRALWSALYSARENSIEVITDIRHIWIIAE